MEAEVFTWHSVLYLADHMVRMDKFRQVKQAKRSSENALIFYEAHCKSNLNFTV
jgi:hypothetical protein